jgi:hypothetical protein
MPGRVLIHIDADTGEVVDIVGATAGGGGGPHIPHKEGPFSEQDKNAQQNGCDYRTIPVEKCAGSICYWTKIGGAWYRVCF